jgi:hypothetical protein
MHAPRFVHNFILQGKFGEHWILSWITTKWTGVLVKAGRSQVVYGLDLSSTSWVMISEATWLAITTILVTWQAHLQFVQLQRKSPPAAPWLNCRRTRHDDEICRREFGSLGSNSDYCSSSNGGSRGSEQNRQVTSKISNFFVPSLIL